MTNGNTSAIHNAAKNGDLEKVKALLKGNPDFVFSKEDEYGRTPLHYAAENGHTAVAEFLLANKAEIDAKSNIGKTPLHLAAFAGRIDVVELLLANKANVNAKDNDGRTPLHWATLRGHKDLAALLLANGADVNANNPDLVFSKDKYGETLLDRAAGYGHTEVAELPPGQTPTVSEPTGRPLLITIICILGFIGVVSNLILLFNEYQTASWDHDRVGFGMILTIGLAICFVGLWRMRAWALAGYITIQVLGAMVLASLHTLTFSQLILPIVFIAILLKYIKRMRG
jgi:Ankyrin repeats (3 copies)/Ankyrin repeat